MDSPLMSENSAKEQHSIKRPRLIWLLLVGIALVGVYASLFIPAMAGQPQDGQSGISSLLVSSLFFSLWWKRRERSHGALIGAAIGLLAFILAAFLSGFMRHA
ncbi:MAG: hypothetical protein QM808_11535 [Steroidobacteraceae bacterium]